MAAVPETRLQPRTMVPVFELTSAEGRPVNTWDYKGRRHLVIAFLPAGCPYCSQFLQTSVSGYHRYETENAEVLVVIRGSQEDATRLHDEIEPPFPIAYDEDGGVTDRYTDRVPAVFVADKFGELYAEWIVGPGGSFPAQKDILDVLELINLECPE